MIYGGDIREEAVGTMASNIGKKYKPIAIQQWDATQLPLKDEEVDKIVCNLPFGKQIGTHKENVELYPRLINEFDRVLKKGGKIVLLTTETTLFEQGLKSKKNWHLVRVLRRVTVLGLEAEIFVIEKEGEQ
jgi:23S rRNA G2445 N2-methylase RlmL